MVCVAKQEKARRTISVIVEHQGEPKTLDEWLRVINENMSNRYAIGTPKKLAHLFRYINICMGVPINRRVRTARYEGQQIMTTYYVLEIKHEKPLEEKIIGQDDHWD